MLFKVKKNDWAQNPKIQKSKNPKNYRFVTKMILILEMKKYFPP